MKLKKLLGKEAIKNFINMQPGDVKKLGRISIF